MPTLQRNVRKVVLSVENDDFLSKSLPAAPLTKLSSVPERHTKMQALIDVIYGGGNIVNPGKHI